MICFYLFIFFVFISHTFCFLLSWPPFLPSPSSTKKTKAPRTKMSHNPVALARIYKERCLKEQRAEDNSVRVYKSQSRRDIIPI